MSLSLTTDLSAQQPDLNKTMVSQARFLGKSAPLSKIISNPENFKPIVIDTKAPKDHPKKYDMNFYNRAEHHGKKAYGALPNGVDRLWNPEQRSMGNQIDPLVNVEGLNQNNSGASPPDETGAIGKDHYIQIVNASIIQIFNKDGTREGGSMNLSTFWSQFGQSSGGDPIVFWDDFEDRWVMTEFPNFQNFLLVAVSDTDDPFGTWSAYEFGTPSFPDYPKYSVWEDCWVVTTNEGGNIPVYCLDKSSMIQGLPNADIVRMTVPRIGAGPGFQVITPIHYNGQSLGAQENAMIIRMVDDAWVGGEDRLEIWEIELDWNNPGAASIAMSDEIIVSPFDSNPCATSAGGGFSCIPQPNPNLGLDGLPEVIMHQANYRNFGSHESIVLNYITDVSGNNHSGIRWVELRQNGGSDWSVYQEGTFAPDDDHRFMGSIAIDANGNIAIGYNISSSTRFPSIGIAGRRASDPLGEMTFDEYIVEEGVSNSQTDRFGDYAHMTIDPVDGKTFWFTSQYMGNNSRWRTKVVAFNLGRDSIDMGVAQVLSPLSSSSLSDAELVSVEFKNFGIDSVDVFEIGLEVDGNFIESLVIDSTLFTDDVFVQEFGTPVDLSAIGDHTIKAYVSATNDENRFNDTLTYNLVKYPTADAGIINIGELSSICGDSTQLNFTIQNFSDINLQSLDIAIELNGNVIENLNWTGDLALNDTEVVSADVVGLIEGSNMVVIRSSNPNGMMDQRIGNDSQSINVDAILSGVEFTLNLTLDFYANETTWELVDENGVVLYQGGDYASAGLVVEQFCLDPDLCYVFTIFDSYGDGVSGFFGQQQGDYEIIDADGLVVASLSEINFGDEESSEFCGTFMCNLGANIDIDPASSSNQSNASVSIIPQNGLGPYQFSIDGGVTFELANIGYTFNNLAPGTYDIYIIDDLDCIYEETIEVKACDLEFTIDTENAANSNSLDGSLIITATSSNPPLMYSGDAGNSYQNSNIFEGLPAGNYNVIVQDGIGCLAFGSATIDSTVPNIEIDNVVSANVYPNPNTGLFHVEVTTLDMDASFIEFEIIDAIGKTIKKGKLNRFNEAYLGQISILSRPNGIYHLRLYNEGVEKLIKLVKI